MGPQATAGTAARPPPPNWPFLAASHWTPPGNLLIADAANNVIREVNLSTGVITTLAGNGIQRLQRGRRPGHRRDAVLPLRRSGGRHREPVHRRPRQQRDPRVDALQPDLQPLTPANLQSVINAPLAGTVTLPVNDPTQENAALSAVDSLTAPPVPIVLNVVFGSGTFTDVVANVPAGVTLNLVGNGTTTTIVGQSPALTVSSGNVIVTGVIFTTATDAPTILVTGGNLTLRNDTVEESSGFTDAAIAITGGTVDLGPQPSPGGNTFNINGTGELLQDATSIPVPDAGNMLGGQRDAAFRALPESHGHRQFESLPRCTASRVTFTASILAANPADGSPTGECGFHRHDHRDRPGYRPDHERGRHLDQLVLVDRHPHDHRQLPRGHQFRLQPH